MSTVPFMMALGVGIELSHWTTVKAQVQRTADLAALAGATEYLIASDDQKSATAAAMLAELNGGAGGATRTWNGTTKLLSDNQVTAQVTAGIRDPQGRAVKVVVRQSVPLVFTAIMGSLPPVTVSATGTAEVSSSVQPCVLAIDSGAGAKGISAQGSVSVNMKDCSMRSNASISAGGSATLAASAFYAAGSITGNEVGDPKVPYKGVIPDPYANYTPVQTAIKRSQPSGISAYDDKGNVPTPSPGTSWTSWDIKGSVTLSPGIYYVYGSITIGAQGSLIGDGVTIVTSSTISMTGGSTLTLSAAKPVTAQDGSVSAPGGAIPGVVFIGTSSSPSTFGGNTGTALTGVIYNPNGDLNFSGTSGGGSSGCLKIIAKSVTFSGTPSLAANCSTYGVKPFQNETANATLIQ